MDISLTSKQKKLIEQKIESGEYNSPEEVIDKALRLLIKYDEKVEAFRRDVQIGLDQLERGEYTDYDEEGLKELAARIKTEGMKRLKARRQQSA